MPDLLKASLPGRSDRSAGMVIQRTPVLLPARVGNVTNYIVLCDTVHGARVGCSKKQRNCSKKVTYGRIHRDTMHMKAIHGRGYHRRPVLMMFHQHYNDDDSEVDDKEDRSDGVL